MNYTKERNADEIQITLLVKQLADLEPHCGGWQASDLPDLSNADIEAICRARAVDMDLSTIDLIEAKGSGRNPAVLLPVLFQQACKAAIFPDVQDEAARQGEIRDEECAQAEFNRRAGFLVEA